MISSSQQDRLVLNIDHDAVRRGARSQHLRAAGLCVVEAADSETGLALIEIREPDLILLDATLAASASRDVGGHIKATWPNIFVIKTADAEGSLQEGADSTDSTADFILSAPLEPRDLVAITDAMLRLRTAEIEARIYQERHRAILDNAEDCAILTCCADGLIKSWNTGARSIFGYEAAEILDKPYAHLFTDQDTEDAPLRVMRAARLGRNVRSERWHRRRDGSHFWAHSRMVPLRDRVGGVAGYLEIVHDQSAEQKMRESLAVLDAQIEQRVANRTSALADANKRLLAEIAERERTDAQLRQAQKIEALGHLTGGIAHDFNNLLTAIMGGLEVIRMRIEDPRTLRLIDSSMSAAARGAKLIAQLMAFARKQKLNIENVDLNALVNEIQQKLEQTVGESVAVSLSLDPAAWSIMADPDQVRVALVNLSVNARETMETGGTLRISTGNETVDADSGTPTLPPGDYGVLGVHDTGGGMSKDALEHLFEPFFTTKDVGKGSGLGLAQVYGFVRQSGGDIRVSSTPGAGTSMMILLPRAAETEESETEQCDMPA